MDIQSLSTQALHELLANTKKQSVVEEIRNEIQFRNDISYSPMTDTDIVKAIGFPYPDEIYEPAEGLKNPITIKQLGFPTTQYQRFPANDVQNNGIDAGESF